jgi:hypothetical protein
MFRSSFRRNVFMAPVLALACLAFSPLQDAGPGPDEDPSKGGSTGAPTSPAIVPATGAKVMGGAEIEDIDLHRVERPWYVRRLEDVVQVDLGDIDYDADVILTIDDDKPISRDFFRRRAVLYMGMNIVEEELTRIVTNVQRERMIEAGVDPETLEVEPGDIDERFDTLLTMIKMQAMGPNPEEGDEGATEAAKQAEEAFRESIDKSMGMDAYRKMLSAESAFERAFLPMPAEATGEEVWDIANGPVPEDDPKPDWMPQISWDALGDTEANRNLRFFVKKHAAEGQEIPSFFRGQITSTIRRGVIREMGLQYFFDAEMPDNVFMRVGGKDVEVDYLYSLIADQLADTDRDLILREMLTLYAVKETLSGVGDWMTDEELATGFADLNKQYEGTLFTLGSMITILGYQSLDRYREHWGYKESYYRWRKKTLTEEDVEGHYRTAGRLLFERGSIEADLAYNRVDTSKPFENARFTEAEKEMMDGYSADTSFDELMAQFPPDPTRQSVRDQAPEVGRLFQRNPLRMRLTESELSLLLTGYSLADELYYHTAPGDVVGPVSMKCRRHSWGAEVNAGVWMAKTVGFRRDRPLAPMEGRDRDQAEEDFLYLNYQYWAQECLKAILPRITPTLKS